MDPRIATVGLLPVLDVYRIAGIFRGYKCSRFSRIEPVPRKFIPTKIYE